MTLSRLRRSSRTILALLSGLIIFLFLSIRIFGASDLAGLPEAIQATPDYGWIFVINLLISGTVVLFVAELGGGALRVTLTVLLALAFGYLMTAIFNLDASNRFKTGDFEVQLISDAEPAETDAYDIAYGGLRGGKLNDASAGAAVERYDFSFYGQSGDVVSILAYAANRRTEVDLQAALLDENGAVLATSTASSEAERERFESLRSERDATIADFTLPADGTYAIAVEAEPVSFGVLIGETVAATNKAYEALLFGPLSRVNRWAIWIQDAITLILVGLAITVVFQAEQFSLGAEGQLYFGALFSGFLALNVAGMPPLLGIGVALLAAVTAGFLWGLVPGILKAYLGANELVATLMLNTIAMRIYDMALTFQLNAPDAGFTTTGIFPEAGLLPALIADTRVTAAIFIVVIAVIATWFVLTRTTLGYEIRMIGANRKFAEYGGINTKRTIMLAMALSGILAGLAGAHLAIGIHRQLILNISLGLAFEGVVVSLLARNNPLVVPFTGLLYAYLRSGAQFMERDANISFEIVRIIQAVIILLITAEGVFAFYQNWRSKRRSAGSTQLEDGFERPETNEASEPSVVA